MTKSDQRKVRYTRTLPMACSGAPPSLVSRVRTPPRRRRLHESCTVHTMTRKTGTVSIKPRDLDAVRAVTRSLGPRCEPRRTGEAKPAQSIQGCAGASAPQRLPGVLERTTARRQPGRGQRTKPKRAVRPTRERVDCATPRDEMPADAFVRSGATALSQSGER